MRRPRDVQAESTTKFFNGAIVVNVSSRVTGVLVPQYFDCPGNSRGGEDRPCTVAPLPVTAPSTPPLPGSFLAPHPANQK